MIFFKSILPQFRFHFYFQKKISDLKEAILHSHSGRPKGSLKSCGTSLYLPLRASKCSLWRQCSTGYFEQNYPSHSIQTALVMCLLISFRYRQRWVSRFSGLSGCGTPTALSQGVSQMSNNRLVFRCARANQSWVRLECQAPVWALLLVSHDLWLLPQEFHHGLVFWKKLTLWSFKKSDCFFSPGLQGIAVVKVILYERLVWRRVRKRWGSWALILWGRLYRNVFNWREERKRWEGATF